MLFAFVVTALALGAVWVYLIPTVQSFVPSSLTSNKYAQVAVTGAMIMLAVWITVTVTKSFTRRKVL